MEWKPNKYLSALLGLFINSFALLYVARPGWSLFYLILPLAILSAEFVLAAPWFPPFTLAMVIAPVCAVHAYFVAARSQPTALRPWYSRWYGISALYLTFVVTVFGIRSFAYEPFRMPSGSMFPTIPVGSYLVVEKYGYGNYGTYDLTLWRAKISRQIMHGDIVVFDSPDNQDIQYVKRVVGLPGDTLLFRNHQLVINDVPVLSEGATLVTAKINNHEQFYTLQHESLGAAHYTVAYTEGIQRTDFEVTVPAHSYFVMGDNRDNSRDSRHWGFVPERNIVGKVAAIIPTLGNNEQTTILHKR